jgi:putative tricarboxylic transport membrane protein
MKPGRDFEPGEAGEVRILAVSSDKRINLWPDVPTMKEAGVDVVFNQWRGFVTE